MKIQQVPLSPREAELQTLAKAAETESSKRSRSAEPAETRSPKRPKQAKQPALTKPSTEKMREDPLLKSFLFLAKASETQSSRGSIIKIISFFSESCRNRIFKKTKIRQDCQTKTKKKSSKKNRITD